MKRFNRHGKALAGVLAITLGAGLAQGVPKPQDAYAAVEHSEDSGIREASSSNAEKEEGIEWTDLIEREEENKIPEASASDAEKEEETEPLAWKKKRRCQKFHWQVTAMQSMWWIVVFL